MSSQWGSQKLLQGLVSHELTAYLFSSWLVLTQGHCQKEDAKSAHTEKRAKNDKIEISGFIFMPATWEYTSSHKITSPAP